MNTNYLAVVCCDHCREMIRTMPDDSIICACTTKRSCKHPEGMGNCHECTIVRLQEWVKEAKREHEWLVHSRRFYVQLQEQRDALQVMAEGLRKALKKPGWENHLEMRHYKALAERRGEALMEYGNHHLSCILEHHAPGVRDCGCGYIVALRAAIDVTPEQAKEKELELR